MGIFFIAFLITRLTAALMSIGIGIVVVKRYLDYRITVILLMLGPAITYFILTTTSLIPTLFPTQLNLRIFSSLQSINSILFFTSILIFFNYFSGEKSTLRMSVVASGITGVFLLQVAAIQTSQPELVGVIYETSDGTLIPDWSGLIYLVLMPVYFLVAVWSYLDIKKSFNNVISEDQKPQLRLMRWGFASIFISGLIINPIAGYLSTINPQYFYWLTHILLLGIFVPLGLGIIALGYLKTEKIAFLQPVQIDGLLVIHKIGTPLFQYDFAKPMQTELGLASGAIKAITAIMEEAFGVSSDINLIEFKNKDLLLEFKEEVAFILITEAQTNFLRSSLQRFSKKFIETYQEQLRQYSGDISEFENAETLVKSSFGLKGK